jgi:Tfp pilus assembly protein PilN
MEQQVNLYQPIMGAEKRLFSAAAIAAGLAILVVCLAGLAAFGAWRTARIERSVAELENQQAAQLEMVARTSAALHPALSLEELQLQAKRLATDIAGRERALDIVRRGTATPDSGFAAKLESLARRQIDGVWLRNVYVASGDSQLALQGSTMDPRLVPAYLAGLAEEKALDGVRFDKLSMRRAKPAEAPAQVVFELSAPGIRFPAAEASK